MARNSVGIRAAVMALAMVAGSAAAQAPGVKATPLLRTPLAGDAMRDVVLADVVFAPGAATGRHSHAGEEYATVLEGALELRVDGQATRRVQAGDTYQNARGLVHETVNVGSVPARAVSTFIIDRNAKLVIPAP